jgi:uncharacterized protein (DUF58 family)
MATVNPSAPQVNRFIDPHVLSRISSLELVARTVVEGFISGLHRSPHLGFSVNFAEYRAYRPGDDIRRIDWKVFARLDKFYVKEYEGETNTSIYLLVDCSRSMAYSTHGLLKLEYAQFLAASLGYFAFRQRDSVGFVAFDEEIREYVPARGSVAHLNTVMHTIEQVRASEKSNFEKPLFQVAERLRRRGMVILISDLYDDTKRILDGLRQIAFRGNDVIVFHLLDPSEIVFGFDESAQFIDLETRAEMHVVPEFLRQEYRKVVKDQVTHYEMECAKDRIDYVMLDTSKPLDHALFTYLLRRETLY